MKIRKRLLSLTLAVMLIVAMAVPASAYTFIVDHSWGNFTYNTSDTCNYTTYSCIIESGSAEYTLRTDVNACIVLPDNTNRYDYFPGYTGTLIATNYGSTSDRYSNIQCYHYIGGHYASYQNVSAS